MTNKKIVIAILLVAVMAGSIVACQKNTSEQLYRKARTLASEGQQAKAVAILERITDPAYADKVHTALAQIYLDWGKQLEAEGNYDLAIEKYQIVLDEFSDSVLAAQAREGIERVEVAKELDKIAALPSDERGDLPPPEGVIVAGLGDPVLMIENGTGYVLTLLYKGPIVTRLVLQPGEVTEITLRPGAYEIAATVPDPSVVPFYGTATFETDYTYESFFYIETVTWP